LIAQMNSAAVILQPGCGSHQNDALRSRSCLKSEQAMDRTAADYCDDQHFSSQLTSPIADLIRLHPDLYILRGVSSLRIACMLWVQSLFAQVNRPGMSPTAPPEDSELNSSNLTPTRKFVSCESSDYWHRVAPYKLQHLCGWQRSAGQGIAKIWELLHRRSSQFFATNMIFHLPHQ
jgi:hypothetical protein